MARLWQCGFELGSTTTGMEFTTSSGTISLQTSTIRTGTYALRANPTSSTGFVRWHAFASDQAIVGYQRFYLNIATLPSSATTICRFLDGSNNSVGAIRLSTGGALQLLQAGGTQVGSSSATLSTGTWYMVELKTDATGSGALDARLDGSSFASGANSAQGNWSRILIGVIGTNATTDLFFDDWALNDASGSAQTSWLGAGKILHLSPNGDGDNHAWGNTANGAGSSTNYTLVDEIPPNDATDLVQSVTLNAEDMYTLTDSGIGSGDVVNVVMVGLRLRDNSADATTTVKAQIKKVTGGTIAQGSSITPNSASFATNAPAEPRNYTLITYLDPDGAAWTQATLDTAQAGVKLTLVGVNRIQVSALWVSVDYTPSSSTPVSGSDTGSAADTEVVSAVLSSAETTSGVDAGVLSAVVSSVETGAATEDASVSVNFTETATGTDEGSVNAAASSSDLSSGTDSGSVTADVPGADSGTDVESAFIIVFAAETVAAIDDTTISAITSVNETAGSSDTASLSAAVSNGDTATGVDTTSISVTITTPDVVSGADTESVGQDLLPVSASETAAGVDSASVVASVPTSDLGSSSDGTGDRDFGTAESSAGADSGAVQATLSSADTVSAVQTEIVAARPAASDDAAGDDAISMISAAVASSDTAIGIDSASAAGGDDVSVNDADTATATDSGSVSAVLTSDDTVISVETAAISAALLVSDITSMIEGTPRIDLTSSDTAGSAENTSSSAALITPDTASGVDVHSALGAATSAADTAAGIESVSGLNASVLSGDTGAGADTSPPSLAAVVNSDAAAGVDLSVPTATVASADLGTSFTQNAVITGSMITGDTASSVDNTSLVTDDQVQASSFDEASSIDLANLIINISDQAAGIDVASVILGRFSSDSVLMTESELLSTLRVSAEVSTGSESALVSVSASASEISRGRDSADVFIVPTRSHRVMPYYIRESQGWAIEQERRRHNEALWYIGENTMFVLMWHLEDFQDNLVGRCPTCYESQGVIATVYGQSDQYKCPDCFGTTFEGGFKALIVRPAIFSDSDEGETKSGRGVVHPQDLTIESTPDFRIRTGDYCFRVSGERYFMRVPERITLRTGFGHATQTETAIGYNHANAAVEDPDSVAYMIPPANDEVSQILNRASRIPRDWSTFEVIRAPLIPSSDLIGGP